MGELILWLAFSGAVRDLGADDYETREQAQNWLERHDWLAWRLCERQFDCPEQRRRARRVVERYLRCTDEPLPVLVALCREPVREWQRGQSYCRRPPPGGRGWVFAWCHPGQGGCLAGLAHCYLRRVRSTTHPWPGWYSVADAQAATALLVRDLLRLGVPAPAVRGLLGWMRAREAAWLDRDGAGTLMADRR